MECVLDLHLHSRFSRAVSPAMTLPVMAQLAVQKGLHILSASDFTHPIWFKEIRALLTETSEGLYGLQTQDENTNNIRFLLSTEISCIYTQGGKLRRIHVLVFMPDFSSVEKFNQTLIKRGCTLSADGRPIIGMSAKDLLTLTLEIDARSLLIPCHVWTPHFGLYGSASGFDSIEECFQDLSQYIYGIETGLSSDPEMNWKMKELEHRSILSFSDAHSAPKMGREATVLVTKREEYGPSQIKDVVYEDIRLAIMRQHENFPIGYTIEFYPEEGKYHFSGHRNCNVIRDPEALRKEGSICPVCKRKLTEGVLYRVEELSTQQEKRVEEKRNPQGLKWYLDSKRHHPPYIKVVPLLEVVAEARGATVHSQKVQKCFQELCEQLGGEIPILLRTPFDEIANVGGQKIAESVEKVRRGELNIDPGYDGVYGKVAIWEKKKEEKVSEKKEQIGLFS